MTNRWLTNFEKLISNLKKIKSHHPSDDYHERVDHNLPEWYNGNTTLQKPELVQNIIKEPSKIVGILVLMRITALKVMTLYGFMDSHRKLSSLTISWRITLQKALSFALKYMASTNKWAQNGTIQTSTRTEKTMYSLNISINQLKTS